MRWAVLSPHPDDAVLSCWHLLRAAGPGVVVNVFTGVPSAGTPVGWWDRLGRAGDAGDRARARICEDREALALAGRSPVNLGLLDGQYRDALAVTPVLDRLGAAVAGCAVLYAPAALGAHPDHVLVRDAALTLRRRGHEVRLYADLPHAIRHGWPDWVSGDANAVAARMWADGLARAGPEVAAGMPMVHVLDEAEREHKLRAVRAYRTQLQALEAVGFPSFSVPGVWRYEVTWELVPR